MHESIDQRVARWSKVAHIVEDNAVLSCELEAATSMRVRKVAMAGGPVKGMVGMHTAKYLHKHGIGDKMAGRVPWSVQDRAWRPQDMEYVDYQEVSRSLSTPWVSTPAYKTEDTLQENFSNTVEPPHTTNNKDTLL